MIQNKRIAILGFRHEAMMTCPFKTDPSTTDVFRGQALLELQYSAITGILSRLAEDSDVEAEPLIFARSLPGGGFERSFYEAFKAESLELLAAHGPYDGVVVANHGAAEVDGLGVHGDTDYICAVRAALGPDVPIAVPFDMHGQVTPALMNALTVLSCLRTAPHRDVHQTSYRATDQLMRVIRTGKRPHKAAVNIPIYIPGEKCMTEYSPAGELFGSLSTYDRIDGVVEAHLFVGFGWNDLPWCGMKSVVLTWDDPVLAEKLALEIAENVWSVRREFKLCMETASIRDGLLRARTLDGNAIYLADSGDNTTCGAGGDLTFVLQEALDLGMTDIAILGIYAPDIVVACSGAPVGSTLEVEIGHHISAAPLVRRVTLTIEEKADFFDASRFADLRSSEGAWVRARIDGIVVTFHAARVSFVAPGHLLAAGVDPSAIRICVVKVGYLHPQQQDMASHYICLLSQGRGDLDFLRLAYSNIPRPAFPMDDAMTWSAPQGLFTAIADA